MSQAQSNNSHSG